MWILFKIAIACIAGLIRLFSKQLTVIRNRIPDYIHKGISIYVVTHKNKNQITSTTFKTPLETRALFRLTRESEYDRFFKEIGISKEIQSGDRDFDDQVYIACDHPVFSDEVQSDSEARRLILQLFKSGAKFISYNGVILEVSFAGDRSAASSIAHTLAELQISIAHMDMHRPAFWGDPYVLRALISETIIWVFAGYAFSGFFQLLTSAEDYHLRPLPVYIQGVLLGLLIALLLVFAVFLLFKGSSRGHRILIEAGVVLGISLPLGGIGLVSDLNRELDQSESVWLEAPVQNLERKVHRKRRGGVRYSYHMYVGETQKHSSGLTLPHHIQIDFDTFEAAKVQDMAKVEVGRGWINHPYYRAIHFRRRF